jgi:hypothetical protein
LITTEGKAHIKRYLAGYVPYIGGSIAFGIGAAPETINDRNLQYEVSKVDVNSISYNFATNAVVFKAPLPTAGAFKTYEMGLYAPRVDATNTFTSKVITSFDSVNENWRSEDGSPATYSTPNSRIGADALLHSPAGGQSQASNLSNITQDFSANAASDRFSFAYSVFNANTNYIGFNFYTDANNYYTFAFGGNDVNSVGYRIMSREKGSAQVTGVPNWERITKIVVSTGSAASGQSNVEYDGIRLDSSNTYGLDNILVARKVLSTPVTKLLGQPQDIEFNLGVNIT